MINYKIKSTVRKTWNFLVGISNIVSCLVSVLSCYIAYHAVLEIISLNVEISPITEKIQKDSIVIIERPIPTFKPQNHSQENHSQENHSQENCSDKPQKEPPIIEQSKESDNSPYQLSSETEKIRRDRDAFIERMNLLFGNRKRLQ